LAYHVGMIDPGPISYEVSSNASYNDDAAKTSKVTLVPNKRGELVEIIIEGPCPRCAHPTLFSEPLVAYMDADYDPEIDRSFDEKLNQVAGEYRERDVLVICRCRGVHPERPYDKIGCGASWSLSIEWDAT
jgi:hypothetical protein